MPTSILLINWRDIRNPEAGGAEIYYHEIFKRLATRGYEVTVLAHRFPGSARSEAVDGIRTIRTGSRMLFNWSAIPFLLRHRKEYDLVIEDLNKIPFYTPLYLRRPRLHLVMHFFGAAIFREIGLPMALYVFCAERLVRLVYRHEKFVAISESTRAEIAAWRRTGADLRVVEPGINTDFFRPVCAKSATPTVACVSRLKKYKNVQLLIRALPALRERVPGVKVVIAGSGEYLETLRVIAGSCGAGSDVQFLGFVSEEQKRDLLSRAWLFVNPSIKEGWGISTIEAGLCGTVSLSADVPGLRDSVRDGETGVLFEQDNIADLVEKAETLLKNAERRRTMEQKAIAFGRTFAWDSVTDKMESVLRSCCT